ncbi:MAG: DUF1924 domain-containing protein [Betaproteobacteria bacterium]|nr:DUF1924 domain-containing protein [Betaproteobacteria bacterium]
MRNLFALCLCLAALQATAATFQDLQEQYGAQARQDNPAFDGFSSTRGKSFYEAKRTMGSDKQSGCFDCHTADPAQPGKTHANKSIGPMAISANPKRFTDLKKSEKWFRRNCTDLLGRPCTAQEKGDFIEFLAHYK